MRENFAEIKKHIGTFDRKYFDVKQLCYRPNKIGHTDKINFLQISNGEIKTQ